MKKKSEAWFWKAAALLVLLNVLALVFVYLNQPQATKPATPMTVAVARDLGLQWLQNNMMDTGLFLYNFDPVLNRIPNTSNALRQLMASRVAALEAGRSKTFADIHQKNLEYVFAYWYKEDAEGGYVLYQDKSKLGSNAMLLRTLVYSPDFEQHRAQAGALAQGIATLQQADGSFLPWYVEPNYAYDANYLLHFYSGEAILALLEYYERSGDTTALQTATRAANFYLDRYVAAIDDNYHPAYVPWHTMSLAHLYKLTGEQRYADATFIMNDRLLQLLDTEVYPGRFFKKELRSEGQEAPHSSSDAVYLEGLLYAYELAEQLGQSERALRYKEAIDVAAGRLITLQYKEQQFGFKAVAERYVGAIPISESNAMIRVDTTQHALDAFAKYLELFSDT